MIRHEPCTKEHLFAVVKGTDAPDHKMEELFLNWREIVSWEDSYTLLDGDTPIMCGGVCRVGHWRGMAWSFMGPMTHKRMVGITRWAKAFLDFKMMELGRIEADVKSDFELGHKWAKLLGFKKESLMRQYDGPDDYVKYVRLRDG